MGCCASSEKEASWQSEAKDSISRVDFPPTLVSPFAQSTTAFSEDEGRDAALSQYEIARHESRALRMRSTDVVKRKLKEIAGVAETASVADSTDEDTSVIMQDFVGRRSGLHDTDLQPELLVTYLQRNTLFADVAPEVLLRLINAFELISLGGDKDIMRQGEVYEEHDKMYVLLEGEVEVTISAGGSLSKRIRQSPGSIFGHLSLIFRSQRTASVTTCGACKLLTLSRPVLMTLPRPSMLAFLRKIPVLAIMSDNDVIELAESCSPVTFSSREYLIRFGDRSEPVVYFIRHGSVRVMRPDSSGKSTQLAVLSRGKVIGQRTVITGRMRSADCIAEGDVDAVAATGSAFAKIDTPLLTGWLDFEAVTTVLKQNKLVSGFTADQLDDLVEDFVLTTFKAGQVVVPLGTFSGFYIVRAGSVSNSDASVREANGFVFIGNLQNSTVIEKDVFAVTDVSILSYISKQARNSAASCLRQEVSGVSYSDLDIKRVIGIGNSGRVFLAQNKDTKVTYALKAMDKSKIRHAKQVQHTKNELQILKSISHPFCTKFVAAYQDPRWLYLLQEWVPGGELFVHLQNNQCFSESVAKFYAANVLMALEHIHSKGIVYRDLKPENLLMDADGYIKIADFGFAKSLDLTGRTFTICGTPEYQAPEIIAKKGTTRLADLWSFGILLFDMLTGFTPFQSSDDDPFKIYRKAASGRFQVPSTVSKTAADLIYKLVVVDSASRLGAENTGAIKSHPWFADVDFSGMLLKTIKAPEIPKLTSGVDTSYFDDYEKDIMLEDTAKQHKGTPGSVISERWLEWDEI